MSQMQVALEGRRNKAKKMMLETMGLDSEGLYRNVLGEKQVSRSQISAYKQA